MNNKTSDFTFRLRFKLAPVSGLNFETKVLEIPTKLSSKSMVLKARLDPDKTINEAQELVLRASGWPTQETANKMGSKCQDAILRTMARVRAGIDLGDRCAKSYLTEYGIEHYEKELNKRVLNDHPGLMVFETDPSIVHLDWNASLKVFPDNNWFLRVFDAAVNSEKVLSDSERLALNLFHSSFFQISPDSRFLMLVMAIESCIIPFSRSSQAIKHLDELIKLTENKNEISESERSSLIGCLEDLKTTSISKAGRELIRTQLAGREYQGKAAEKFFTECYDIRSRLVHVRKKKSSKKGFPTFEEVNSYAAQLEVMVSDLLSADLLDIES
jgi:hypothetical protein